MNLKAPANRDGYLFDLSRWNRAGLSRFEYVDGDAAVWLEELRIALQGLYFRGIDPADRTPEKWRDLFMKPIAERQLNATAIEFETSSVWKDLFTAFPLEIETGGKRNQRLLEQYDLQSQDYGWETMRAFARAAHIILGHLDAYANEGYLRSATQWENLRKLAAMVNYQPTPPASATTTVALEIESGKAVIEIARGLAMKYAPPEGGAPLIFETLKPVQVHPDLGAARSVDWDYNRQTLQLNKGWIVPEKAELAQGDLAVITDNNHAEAVSLSKVQRDQEKEWARLEFDPVSAPAFNPETGDTLLLTEPEAVQVGLPRSSGNVVVIKIDGANSYSAGSIVEVTYNGGVTQAVVIEGAKGLLSLDVSGPFSGDVEVEALIPYTTGFEGDLETPLDITGLYYKRTAAPGNPVLYSAYDSTRQDADSNENIARVHNIPSGISGLGYARFAGTRVDAGRVVSSPPIGSGTPDKVVRFEGAPPRSLQQDAWYVAREVGSVTLEALQVDSIRLEADVYYVVFKEAPTSDHDETEFFGPMTRSLHPLEYDRDQRDAVIGGVAILENLSPEARDLVKIGNDVIVIYHKNEDPRNALAVITAVEVQGSNLRLDLQSDTDLSGWQAGWTKFYLNTVDISHGETKDPKILGSGDAEQRRQNFQFKITDVSFIPSTTAATGVAPDMDVTVDGVKWEFRDLGDPRAEGADAWSSSLNEDDTLQIHFRRRLPTGTNNVSILRHRIGVGSKGSGVPAWSINKPMKKNRFVTGIIQPFASAGGAMREPVSDIRENAPSKLAANGRAVSLRDFEQLCRRHSSVWQAKAREVIGPGALNHVDIVIVPANGGVVNTTLESDLIDFVETRALPNTRVTITDYQSMPLSMQVEVYVDTSRYEKSDVKDAVEAALVAGFALKNRSLGQPVYVAEILATMERVSGVSSATITAFARKSTAPEPLREAVVNGRLAAIYPTEEQVAVLNSSADVTVDVEVLT